MTVYTNTSYMFKRKKKEKQFRHTVLTRRLQSLKFKKKKKHKKMNLSYLYH